MNQKTIKLFFAVCAIFGTFPCLFDGKSWRPIRFYTVWILTLSAICVLGFCYNMMCNPNEKTKFTEHVHQIEEPILVIFHTVIIISNKNKLCKLMNLISQQCHPASAPRDTYPVVTWIWGLLIILGFAIQIAVFNDCAGYYMLKVILTMFVVMTLILSTHQFSLLVRLAAWRFNELNLDLIRMANYPDGLDPRPVVTNYIKLEELVEAICDTYGSTLLIIVPICLINASLSSTYILINLQNITWLNNFLNILYGSYFVLMMLDITSSCEMTLSQVSNFNNLLRSCAMKFPHPLITNPFVAMHFITKKPLSFTVCKCFNITYRLGCSMLAACITYLIVLMQIDKPTFS